MSANKHGKVDQDALRTELAATRRALWVVLALGLVLSGALGYCAIYFRMRCNGFEKKLDTIYLKQLTQQAAAPASPRRAPEPASVPASAAAALVASSGVPPKSAHPDDSPPSIWAPPALPGGLPPPVDLAPLLAPLAKGDAPHPPRPLFDEIDLFEQGNRVFYENACYYFRSHGAYSGSNCFEFQLEEASGRVIVQPRFLALSPGDVLSVAFRKTRAASRLWMGLITEKGEAIVAHERPGGDGPGQLKLAESSAWRELDLDPAALARAQGVALGNGRIQAVFFGLTHGAVGDSLYVDRVWTGPRPVSGVPVTTGTVTLAGRVSGPTGGVTVTMVRGTSVATTVPTSGAFAFRGLPAGAAVELWAERDGRRSFSPLGDVIQVTADVSDAHLLTEDLGALRSPGPVKPEWSNYGGPGVEKYATQFPPHKPMFYTGVIGQPLEYSNTLIPNRFGVYDRDHRFDDPDQRQRILVLGDCQLEGIQTDLGERTGPRLESLLRRRYGRDVEVLTLAHSNAHPAAVWSMYEKLGRQFKPDLVLIDVNAPSVVQMEPRLLKNLTGWDPAHSAYGSMVLGPDDVLKYVPGDPNYPVYAGKPTYALLDGVPPNWVMHLKEEQQCAEAKALSKIFKAVIARYVKDAREYGAQVAVYTGARVGDFAKPQVYAGKPASQEQFVANMHNWAREAGATHLDISRAVASHGPNFAKVHFWKMDGHPTPTGHYWIAEALADQLIAAGLVH